MEARLLGGAVRQNPVATPFCSTCDLGPISSNDVPIFILTLRAYKTRCIKTFFCVNTSLVSLHTCVTQSPVEVHN